MADPLDAPIPALAPDERPLAGLVVLDFSQFLAGPSAALRLADLGARVIKIERPGSGDLCRQLYISNLELDGDSTLFHSINRNKESFAADLKRAEDLTRVRDLIAQADILIRGYVNSTRASSTQPSPGTVTADRGETSRARIFLPRRFPA
jgi:crotonobetainyl-CoA:carnitine CoA-transferase CaiB-like acyl-CoA transferase